MENNIQEQNNQDIINKLMTNDSHEKEAIKDDEQISISTARVSGIKYRLYVLIFLTLIIVGIVDYILPSWDKILNLRNGLQDKEQQITNFLQKKSQYEKDKDLIALIEEKENKIISCVNNKIACKELDQNIRENFGFVRSYLQLNNLSDPKMEINEKILLANINEYLLKSTNENDGTTVRNGKTTSISFGDPTVVVSQLYSIPVRLEASFENKDQLLAFIENVDKNVLENKKYRILYKIDEINYDIMDYDQEQTVDIQMHAFYYKE